MDTRGFEADGYLNISPCRRVRLFFTNNRFDLLDTYTGAQLRRFALDTRIQRNAL